MQLPHLPVAEAHTEHPKANALDSQQWPPKQAALAHQSSVEHVPPVGWLFFGEHVEAALTEYSAWAQQRLPTHESLTHQLSAEHVAPVGWLFFSEHVEPALT